MYSGRRTIWSTRLIGRMVLLSSTLPLAIPVKTRNQSVQGVTKSIIRPVLASMESGKKTRASTNANSGVQMKFTHNAVDRKRMFVNALLIFPTSTERNTRNSMTMRNGSIQTES